MAKKDKENGSELAVYKASEFRVAQDVGSLAEVLDTNLGGEKFDLNLLDRIRIPAGGVTQWSIPGFEGDEYAASVEGVIVGVKMLRAFWAVSFDKAGGNTPPDCYSNDTEMGYGDPLQDGQVGWYSCHECPNSKFGSADKGDGQACKEMRMVLVIRKEDLLPIVVSLPPTSIKPLRQYLMRLSTKGLKYHDVITRFKLKKATSGAGITYAVADFEVAGMTDNKEVFSQYREDISKVIGSAVRVTTDDYSKQEEGNQGSE